MSTRMSLEHAVDAFAGIMVFTGFCPAAFVFRRFFGFRPAGTSEA